MSEICDIFINEVVMKQKNMGEESKVNLNLQSKTKKNLETKNEEKMMKHNLKNYIVEGNCGN
jgi:hypothetical protein